MVQGEEEFSIWFYISLLRDLLSYLSPDTPPVVQLAQPPEQDCRLSIQSA